MRTWITTGGMLLLTLGAAGRAEAQTSPQAQLAAPAAWMRYAHEVGEHFQALLDNGGDEAQRVRQALTVRADATGPAAAPGVPPSVAVRTWIGRDGAITRIEFDSLDDIPAEASLEHLLTTAALPPPPADMLQPLRVRLELVPNPDAPPAASDARAGG
ncbi:YbaB/EbfC family DNA-binding protein [Burkholderia sp. Ac-20379]|nr:YbaB/EbfC family DNA-binding protein [Burkholderia sp. Ac-20379]